MTVRDVVPRVGRCVSSWETGFMTVEVVAYREEWPAQFAVIASRLGEALAAVPSARVEHVGSTAIPGLVA
ncbi:GrpB family protein, partial [Nocardioides psychrotolerans]